MKAFYHRISEINRQEAIVGTTLERSWGQLGTARRMKELAVLMNQACKAARTDLEKRRVESWRKGVWEYMLEGRRQYVKKTAEKKQK